jgi:hypothetical protein
VDRRNTHEEGNEFVNADGKKCDIIELQRRCFMYGSTIAGLRLPRT